MKFEWDQNKAYINEQKHQIAFEEAQTVFYDSHALIFDDEWHSLNEQREIIIGYSQLENLLLVVFTERSTAIRIISARKATRRERKDYEQNG